MLATGACQQYGERDGDHHKQDGSPGGELGEQIGCAAWAECSLRTLAAECAGEICRLALLQQDNADKEHADNDVKDNENINHRNFLKTSKNGIRRYDAPEPR